MTSEEAALNSLIVELEVEEANVRKASKSKMKSDSRENSRNRKRTKPNTRSETNKPRKPLELETDPDILQRRQKQIDYGKNTVGYHNYLQEVPLGERTSDHPSTPDKYFKYSRRSWDALIKLWRKNLHSYDTEPNSGQISNSDELD